jgi:hypothetical protein
MKKIGIAFILLVNVFANGYTQEDKTNKWLQSNIAIQQENWLKSASASDQTVEAYSTTPPGEPVWGAPIKEGLYPLLAMLLSYSTYLFYRNRMLKRRQD